MPIPIAVPLAAPTTTPTPIAMHFRDLQELLGAVVAVFPYCG